MPALLGAPLYNGRCPEQFAPHSAVADLIMLSMNKVQQVLDDEKRGTKMIMQVHDELVFEVPEAEVEWVRLEIPRLMAGVAELKVPLLAEIGFGPNWEKAH